MIQSNNKAVTIAPTTGHFSVHKVKLKILYYLGAQPVPTGTAFDTIQNMVMFQYYFLLDIQRIIASSKKVRRLLAWKHDDRKI